MLSRWNVNVLFIIFFGQIALTHAEIKYVINQLDAAFSDARPDIGTLLAVLHALKIAYTDSAL